MTIRLSITTPPPTPVPRVSIRALERPTALPIHCSPRVATFTSFPAFTGSPVSWFSTWATGYLDQPRLAAPTAIPSPVTGLGTPTPMPSTSWVAMPISAIFPRTALATSSKMWLPLSRVSVLISHLVSSSPVVSNTPSLQAVPPTSTPMTYFFIKIPLFPYFSKECMYCCKSTTVPVSRACSAANTIRWLSTETATSETEHPGSPPVRY